ncbi:Six-hairpin glycosidase [Flagelloscypha sp. PMI_526]|nr:Six-hairpin glycosidase [Flagelloscypha sp. PMI_526]
MAPLVRQLTGLVALSTAKFPTWRPALQDGFTNTTIDLLRTNLISVAKASWERGTAAEALLELSPAGLSVYGEDSIPPPAKLPKNANLTDFSTIVNDVVAAKPPDSKPLIDGQGSVADPASLGSSVLFANWTRTDKHDESYDAAAKGQLDYLLNDAPRSPSGAISHRVEQVQLWSDFVYMVPPFLATYGAFQKNLTLLEESFNQISLYRDALHDEATGLWRHIALGNWTDDNLWATGNAWAAAGALRVLQTINSTTEAKTLSRQQHNLTEWIGDIITGAWSFQTEEGLLHNVLNDPTSFTDTASTALLAATTYRYAILTHNSTLVPAANHAFEAIQASTNLEGWLEGTVDPYSFYAPSQTGLGQYSPEGQAFALMLQSAWRDYVDVIKVVKP